MQLKFFLNFRAVPSATIIALIRIEFKNEPDFVAQVVMVSTLFSAITLTGVIYQI
jgi:malate permease and related proteins